MKWANSRKSNFLIVLFLSLLPKMVLSQEHYSDVNLIIIIDNKLVTQNLELNFQQTKNDNFKFIYGVGKTLKLPKQYLTSSGNTYLRFSFSGLFKKRSKEYNYDIDFKKGWINNTEFLILRIYNLDKREYSKAFCKKDVEYIVEVENSVYNNREVLCNKLEPRF